MIWGSISTPRSISAFGAFGNIGRDPPQGRLIRVEGGPRAATIAGMADHSKVELSRLREIGWKDWDPIGLADSSCSRDEYDAYLLQAVGRLRQGQTIDQVAEYLEETASSAMGLGPSTPASRAASERTATLIGEYLANFPPGPLKVR